MEQPVSWWGISSDGDALTRLAMEIDDLERRLGLVSAELRSFQSAPARQPKSGEQPEPQQPHQQAVRSPTKGARHRSLFEALGKEGAGSRLLAWVGAGVTLLGIVLLLVLAIQRGWFGPLPRLIVGGIVGLGLIGTGLWLHCKPAGRTGAFALTATGIAALYLDAIASTTLYGYLPPPAGLAVGLVVALGGLLLAAQWRSVLLGMAVVVGCAVWAPLITQGFTPGLVVFLLMVQVATTPVQLRRNFSPVAMVAGIAPVVSSVLSTAMIGVPSSGTNTIAALTVGVIAIVLGLLVGRSHPGDPAALVLLASAAVPALATCLVLPKSQAVGVSGGMAVVLLAVWASRRWWPDRAGDCAGAAGLIALLQATLTEFDGTARATWPHWTGWPGSPRSCARG